MKLNTEELKAKLKTNKQFINYNGSNEIKSIREYYNKTLMEYTYIVNEKIAVEYVSDMANARARRYYLRIYKVRDINFYNN